MIHVFDDMATADALAAAVPDPKLVWWDITRIVVYTGTDIPQQDQPTTQEK